MQATCHLCDESGEGNSKSEALDGIVHIVGCKNDYASNEYLNNVKYSEGAPKKKPASIPDLAVEEKKEHKPKKKPK